MADKWGSVRGSRTATVSPTQLPGVVAEGFGVRSGFSATVKPSDVDVSTSFGISGLMGLLIVLALLYAVDRYL